MSPLQGATPGWLAQLAPEHAPPPPGWWPPAPGWWVIALLGAALIGGLLWWLRRPPGTAAGLAAMMQDALWSPRRAALEELSEIRERELDAVSLARAIQNLLRRYALTVFGHERVASLAGEAWLALVVSEGGERLAGGPGRSLLVAAFGGRSSDDREQWLAGAEAFLRHARGKPRATGAR
jgi:hypothetical protein